MLSNQVNSRIGNFIAVVVVALLAYVGLILFEIFDAFHMKPVLTFSTLNVCKVRILGSTTNARLFPFLRARNQFASLWIIYAPRVEEVLHCSSHLPVFLERYDLAFSFN
jgi:hypothetical protein